MKHKLYEIVMVAHQEWFGGRSGLTAALERALAEVPKVLSLLEEQLFRKVVLNREQLSTRGGHEPLRTACETVARYTDTPLFGDE